jgi:hypothetical protein
MSIIYLNIRQYLQDVSTRHPSFRRTAYSRSDPSFRRHASAAIRTARPFVSHTGLRARPATEGNTLYLYKGAPMEEPGMR